MNMSDNVRVLLFPTDSASPGADATPAGENAPSEDGRPREAPPVLDKQLSRLMNQA